MPLIIGLGCKLVGTTALTGFLAKNIGKFLRVG
jgi:hypothetical protein